MVSKPHLLYIIPERSYFAIVKKEIHQAAVKANFNDKKISEIDIIVAELVSNLVKHAGGGYLLVKFDGGGLELISIDEGKGMADVNRMMQDGISTKNTLGQGLGAIKRLSDFFQVYSLKDWGTIVLSRVYNTGPQHVNKQAYSEIAAIIVAKPGETSCGDGAYIKILEDRIKIFLGDGLGHGFEAEKAIKEAISLLDACVEKTAFENLQYIHQYVKKTRGLVGTVAFLKHKEKRWNLCGIGNINTRIIEHTQVKNYMAYNGVLGLTIPRTMKDQETGLEKGQILIMCSDGIKTRWDTSKYLHIFKYDLTIMLAAIFKDQARKTDDMSLLAVKCNY